MIEKEEWVKKSGMVLSFAYMVTKFFTIFNIYHTFFYHCILGYNWEDHNIEEHCQSSRRHER